MYPIACKLGFLLAIVCLSSIEGAVLAWRQVGASKGLADPPAATKLSAAAAIRSEKPGIISFTKMQDQEPHWVVLKMEDRSEHNWDYFPGGSLVDFYCVTLPKDRSPQYEKIAEKCLVLCYLPQEDPACICKLIKATREQAAKLLQAEKRQRGEEITLRVALRGMDE